MSLGEYTVRSAIEIARPVEDVYAFVVDSENDPLWCHLVPKVIRVDEDEAGRAPV